MAEFSNRQKRWSEKVFPWFAIAISTLSGFSAFLVRGWSLLRSKFSVSQLAGIAGSLGSFLITVIFSAILVSEIRKAVLKNAEDNFRPDLDETVRTAFYNRYLFFRFFLLGAYSIALLIAIGEIFALCVGAALAPVLLPSFIVGASIFTLCQVVELFKLRDEWRHEINWGVKAELEDQIISTWIGLGLLLLGAVVGFLGFSMVSTGLLVFSGIVLGLKIVNALAPKEPIQWLFSCFGIALFEDNEYHAREIYGPNKKRGKQNDFYLEMKMQYPNHQNASEDDVEEDEAYFFDSDNDFSWKGWGKRPQRDDTIDFEPICLRRKRVSWGLD